MPIDREKSWSTRPVIAPRVMTTLRGLVVLGIVAFVVALRLEPMRAWQAYLFNFLFWSGIAQGGVVFAATYHVVDGKWGPTVRRLAEGMAVILPLSFLLFLPLYFALDDFYAPVRELNPARGAWFDSRFIFIRGGLGLGLMTVLSVLFGYYSLRPEVGWALERKRQSRRWFYAWMIEGWQGDDVEAQRCRRGMDVLAAGVLLAYPITYTFMAFDLIMSLDPFWYSSLFGGYFFISTFYLGLAGITAVTVFMRYRLGPSLIAPSHLYDLARLLLGFNLTYLAMAWSQYIVIWYGNLPEETHFIILRLWERPWAFFSWGSLVLSVLIPFVIFLSQSAKQVPGIVLAVSISIAVGLWVERYILVVPSLWHYHGVPLGWVELGITLGFFGAWGLSYLFFLRHFPVIPFAQSVPPVAIEERDSNKRFKITATLVLALAFVCAGASIVHSWPWSKDMKEQPSIRPQEAPRVPPAQSVPRQGKEARVDRTEAGKKLTNPVKATTESLEMGKQLFQTYCALCHGPDGKGNGPVATKFVPPPDLTLEIFRKRPDGFIYETIRSGGPIMPGQGEALTAEEKWHIVNYLRSLQPET